MMVNTRHHIIKVIFKTRKPQVIMKLETLDYISDKIYDSNKSNYKIKEGKKSNISTCTNNTYHFSLSVHSKEVRRLLHTKMSKTGSACIKRVE